MKWIAGILVLFASVVLLMATAFLWRRSYRASDVVTWVGPTDSREVASYAGAVHVRGLRPALPAYPTPRRVRAAEPVPAGATWRTRRPFAPQVEWARAGFVYASGAEVSGFLPLTSYQVGPPPAGVNVQAGASVVLLDTLTTKVEAIVPPKQVLQGTGRGALTFTGGSSLIVWPLTNHQVVVVPYWAIAALVGVPVWWFMLMLPWRVRAWRRGRRREGAGHA